MFMDIGFGILLSFFVGNIYGLTITKGFIFLGIFFTLLPDVDFLLTKNSIIRKFIGGHRSATHFPSIHLFTTAILWMLFGEVVALLYFLGVFVHLLHDSIFLGWGIKWLWPFSQKSFSFFHDKGGRITKDILTWLPENEAQIKAEYSSPNWVRDFYFSFSIISILEYGIFVIALIFLYSRLYA